MASLMNLLGWRRPVGVTKAVTPIDPIEAGIDCALAVRRAAREGKSASARAGHATRERQRLPDPVVSVWRR